MRRRNFLKAITTALAAPMMIADVLLNPQEKIRAKLKPDFLDEGPLYLIDWSGPTIAVTYDTFLAMEQIDQEQAKLRISEPRRSAVIQ